MKSVINKITALGVLLRLAGLQTRRIRLREETKFLLLTRLSYAGGEMQQTVWLDMLQLNTSTGNKIIEKLEKEGLISKNVPTRRDGAIINLTPKGKKYIDDTFEYEQRFFMELNNLWQTETEQELAAKVLDKLNDHLASTLK